MEWPGELQAVVALSGSGGHSSQRHRPRLPLPELKSQGSELKIEVTGVAANRIRDLDQRHIEWRIFTTSISWASPANVSTPPPGPSLTPACHDR